MTRFLKFIVTGGLAAGVNVGLRWMFSAAIGFEAAVALAYLIAMTVAFVLSRLFVFDRSEAPVRAQFLRFALVNLVSLVMVWSVSVLLYRVVFPLADMTWNPATTAHMIGVLSPVIVAYFLHKNYTFAPLRGVKKPSK